MGLNNADIGGADLFADAIRSYTSICRSESHPRFDCMNIRPAKAEQSIVRTITPSPSGGCRKNLFVGRVSDSVTRQAVEVLGYAALTQPALVLLHRKSGGSFNNYCFD